MASPRVRRGRKTQELVAQYLAVNGWPDAESRPASLAGTDIIRVADVAVEVKARRDFAPLLWMRQARANATAGQVPFVVMRPDGAGETTIGDWPAFLPLRDLVTLLHAAGYGEGT